MDYSEEKHKLHLAISLQPDLQTVEAFLDDFPDWINGVNSAGTPFIFIASASTPEIFDLFISKGSKLTGHNYAGTTLLHYLIRYNFAYGVKAVLDIDRAELNEPNNMGVTPLHYAAIEGKGEIKNILS